MSVFKVDRRKQRLSNWHRCYLFLQALLKIVKILQIYFLIKYMISLFQFYKDQQFKVVWCIWFVLVVHSSWKSMHRQFFTELNTEIGISIFRIPINILIENFEYVHKGKSAEVDRSIGEIGSTTGWLE